MSTAPPGVELRRVCDLKPHPMNAEIYGDHPDDEFIASVKKHGVLTDLLVTGGDVIVSGHRRYLAAKLAGVEGVRVRVLDCDDELDVLEALVESNRQRVKTTEQLAREAQALLRVEQERAKRRQQATLKQNASTVQEEVPEREKGQARDQVGKALGVSGKKAEALARAADAIDRLERAGDVEKAQGVKEALNKGGAKAAERVANGIDPA